MNLVIICERHNYRDVPVYELSGDTPECMACIREQDAEQAAWLAYCDSRSQCNMCIAGGDCYRHGVIEDYPPATADEFLLSSMLAPSQTGYLPYVLGFVIDSPNYCAEMAPPF